MFLNLMRFYPAINDGDVLKVVILFSFFVLLPLFMSCWKHDYCSLKTNSHSFVSLKIALQSGIIANFPTSKR